MSKRIFVSVSATLLAFLLQTACAQDPVPPSPLAASVLDGYQLVKGPITVTGIEKDLSGMTYDAASQSLWLIVNGHPTIFETDLDGNVRRTIALEGFEDTEDLVSLGNQQVAVIEERRRTISVCALAPETMSITRPADAQEIEPELTAKLGLEGIAFDPQANRLFVVKEMKPRRIYQVDRAVPVGDAGAVTHPWDVEANGFGLIDLSAVYWDAASGHLLLLGDESPCVVECTPDGKEIARLALTAGSAGLTADMDQPEGIALTPDGRLYIVGEPNLLYIFAKP